jgi:hypothetical protein
MFSLTLQFSEPNSSLLLGSLPHNLPAKQACSPHSKTMASATTVLEMIPLEILVVTVRFFHFPLERYFRSNRSFSYHIGLLGQEISSLQGL